MDRLPMLFDRERLTLGSPGVGTFTCALPKGAVVTAGLAAGVRTTLGRSIELVVPDVPPCAITSQRPDLVRAPVGYGTVLYELVPLDARAAAGELRAASGAPAHDALLLRAASSGRFYRRAAPDAPAFAEDGALIEDGRPVGLLEVMKTFTHVHYKAAGGLPPRARIVRFLAADAGDVREGDALLEVEPV
jgi:biotin carboxyl carrier protein